MQDSLSSRSWSTFPLWFAGTVHKATWKKLKKRILKEAGGQIYHLKIVTTFQVNSVPLK